MTSHTPFAFMFSNSFSMSSFQRSGLVMACLYMLESQWLLGSDRIEVWRAQVWMELTLVGFGTSVAQSLLACQACLMSSLDVLDWMAVGLGFMFLVDWHRVWGTEVVVSGLRVFDGVFASIWTGTSSRLAGTSLLSGSRMTKSGVLCSPSFAEPGMEGRVRWPTPSSKMTLQER